MYKNQDFKKLKEFNLFVNFFALQKINKKLIFEKKKLNQTGLSIQNFIEKGEDPIPTVNTGRSWESNP